MNKGLCMKNSAAIRFQIAAMTPAIIIFIMIYVISISVLIVTSFFEWEGIRIGGFVGFRNYIRMLTDPVESPIFFRSLQNNVIWSICAVFIHLPLALLAALILNTKITGWKIFRTLFFIPHLISIAAFAIIFKQVFSPGVGILSGLLDILGFNQAAKINWLFDPRWAWPAIISTWLFHIGFFTVIYLAEMTAIPKELYESADLDGVSPSQKSLRITLPLMRNVIGTTAILTVTGGLKYFEGIFLMTNGGPNYRTNTLSVYLYQKMSLLQNSYANALGVALLLIGIIVILVFSRIFSIGKDV